VHQVFRMTPGPFPARRVRETPGSRGNSPCAVPPGIPAVGDAGRDMTRDVPVPGARWNGVRAHLPGPDGRLTPALFASLLLTQTRRRGKATVPTRLGIALIALSLCVAFATTGVPYLMQRHQETEDQAFLTGLARFGPTPTPLPKRAPVIPVASVGTGNGVAAPFAMQPTQPASASGARGPSAAHLAPPPLSPIEPGPVIAPSVMRPPPTHLTIPSLGVDTDVMMVNASPTVVDGQAVAIWNVPGDAVGHHANSANPGEGENVVFNGHDDLGSAVFRDLWRVQPGAAIMVRAGDTTWQYHVETVLAPQEIGVPLAQRLANARYIEPTGDERLTLITCWPAGTNDHRIIVIARLG